MTGGPTMNPRSRRRRSRRFDPSRRAEEQRHRIAIRPQRAKPRTAGTVFPIRSTQPSASATSAVPTRSSRRRFGVDEIPAESRDGHPEREAGERHGCSGGACSGVVLEVDAAPVADGALGQHDQEAEAADQEHRARRECESVARRGVARHGSEAPSDPEAQQPESDADDQALNSWIEARRSRDCDDSGGDESSDAPAAVKGRHDRPPEALLDRDPVSVHRDVHRAVARSEHEENRCEHQRSSGQQGKRQQQTEHECRPPRDRGARPAVEDQARQRHCDHRPRRHTKKAKTEGRFRDAEMILEPRNVGDPGPHHRAVYREDQERREPRAQICAQPR